MPEDPNRRNFSVDPDGDLETQPSASDDFDEPTTLVEEFNSDAVMGAVSAAFDERPTDRAPPLGEVTDVDAEEISFETQDFEDDPEIGPPDEDWMGSI